VPGAHRAPRWAGPLLALAALTACSDSSALPEQSPTGSSVMEEPQAYVALGDSFTAAPYVPRTDFADGCLRSSGNYPALVAAELGARLTDVSCSGADTGDVTAPQRETIQPQLKAVRPTTDLVTVGIGGNDRDLFAMLVYLCTSLAGEPGTPCVDVMGVGDGSDDPIPDIGRRVETTLEEVRRAAPDATVVLVGYPRLVNPDRGCPGLRLAPGDRPRLAALEERLNQALSRAARRTGSLFANPWPVSQGHEICSDDPWVNGAVTDQTRALAFHPFAEGQRAMADAVLSVLERE
jgi:lysophospholipase L1-like esterase